MDGQECESECPVNAESKVELMSLMQSCRLDIKMMSPDSTEEALVSKRVGMKWLRTKIGDQNQRLLG